MGLFFKRKQKESPGIPPPPPPEDGEEAKAEQTKEELPELPELSYEQHMKSDMPEIKPKEMKKPEFPEIPKEDFPEEPEEEKRGEYEKPEAKEAPEEYKKEEAAEEHYINAEAAATIALTKGPKFVTAARFQNILNEADSIRDSIKETEETIRRINGLKEAEQKELEKWRAHIEDVEKKLNYVDRVIFKGE